MSLFKGQEDTEENLICPGDTGLLFIRVSQGIFRVLIGPQG
jgi:hypothetical protein